jgi:hypothetical protein
MPLYRLIAIYFWTRVANCFSRLGELLPRSSHVQQHVPIFHRFGSPRECAALLHVFRYSNVRRAQDPCRAKLPPCSQIARASVASWGRRTGARDHKVSVII